MFAKRLDSCIFSVREADFNFYGYVRLVRVNGTMMKAPNPTTTPTPDVHVRQVKGRSAKVPLFAPALGADLDQSASGRTMMVQPLATPQRSRGRDQASPRPSGVKARVSGSSEREDAKNATSHSQASIPADSSPSGDDSSGRYRLEAPGAKGSWEENHAPIVSKVDGGLEGDMALADEDSPARFRALIEGNNAVGKTWIDRGRMPPGRGRRASLQPEESPGEAVL